MKAIQYNAFGNSDVLAVASTGGYAEYALQARAMWL